jgi:DNA-binding transcriptional MerR regulator
VSGPAGLTIGEAARVCELPVETVRYYDREGLLGELPRDSRDRRAFDEPSLGLLRVVVALRRTGMPMEAVREFCASITSGGPVAERLEMLRRHQHTVTERMTRLEKDLALVTWKVAAYAAAVDGTPPPPEPQY